MIFYLSIRTDRKLTHVPHIDSIDITLNGEEKHCTWDETDASVSGYAVIYRLKGVAFDDENGVDHYANGTVKEDTVVTIDKDFNWKEDDDAEDFGFTILHFEISDYDYENNKEVRLVVVREN